MKNVVRYELNQTLDAPLLALYNKSVIYMTIFYTVNECVETWSNDDVLNYSYAILVIVWVVPLICITVLYTRIGYYVCSRPRVSNTVSTGAIERERALKRKLISLIILLVFFFLGCWGPYFIRNCIPSIQGADVVYSLESQDGASLNAYLNWLGNANAAIDPVLYALLHQKIREEFLLRSKSAMSTITGLFKSLSEINESRNAVSPKFNATRRRKVTRGVTFHFHSTYHSDAGSRQQSNEFEVAESAAVDENAAAVAMDDKKTLPACNIVITADHDEEKKSTEKTHSEEKQTCNDNLSTPPVLSKTMRCTPRL